MASSSARLSRHSNVPSARKLNPVTPAPAPAHGAAVFGGNCRHVAPQMYAKGAGGGFVLTPTAMHAPLIARPPCWQQQGSTKGAAEYELGAACNSPRSPNKKHK
eukprot:1158385-Pelagomonas_calceolata.AAC.3